MRTVKEEEVSRLITTKRLAPSEAFRSGHPEESKIGPNLNKQQVEELSSIREILTKGVQGNIEEGKNLLSLLERLIKGMESNSSGFKEELKTSIGRLIVALNDYTLALKKSIPVTNEKRPTKWKFDINRDSQGRIESVEAEPKEE